MAIELVAHASGSSTESRTTDLQTVVENLGSSSAADKLFAVRQISIWVLQKSQQAQEFVDQGHVRLVCDALRASDGDTPSSSSDPDVTLPLAQLLLDFAREGRRCQDALAASGGVPLLLDCLPSEPAGGESADVATAAAAALCLVAVGSEEGRKEIMLAGGLADVVRCMGPEHPIALRAEAAGIVLGLATEKKERQAAVLEAGALQPLQELLRSDEVDSIDSHAQLAALNAAAALRRLCDASAAAARFCHTGGLELLVQRIVDDEPADRLPLRLPMPLAPSTVRAECKQLLGDVYVGSDTPYQEKIVQVLEGHGITIDRITTTPTASEQTLEGKDSMERGHRVLSCRTSVPAIKVPEIKLHLKRAMRPRAAKPAAPIPIQPVADGAKVAVLVTSPVGSGVLQPHQIPAAPKPRVSPLRRLMRAFACIQPPA